MTQVSVPGHFGEWLQGRLGPQGPVALLTLPCPALRVTAGPETRPTPPPPFNSVQLDSFFRALGVPRPKPWPLLVRDMPLGAGAGASTATLMALAQAAGFDGPAEVLAKACIDIEGASDPLMLPAPDQVLWASREGRVLAELPAPPACDILGGFWGAPERTNPEDEAFDDITDLVELWKVAAGNGDLAECAMLAAASAQRCSQRRSDARDPTSELARALGALGHVRAHTGSARGLIFPRGAMPAKAPDLMSAAGLHSVFRFRAGAAQ